MPLSAPCPVVGVKDGDTLSVRCGQSGDYQQLTVRLGSIDAPEQRQDFGQRAKQAMSDLVFQRTVELQCAKKERYDRLVCNIYRDGRDVALFMVQTGMAWWYTAYAREQTPQDRRLSEAAQSQAKAVQAGLWSMPEPTPPWDWRKSQRGS